MSLQPVTGFPFSFQSVSHQPGAGWTREGDGMARLEMDPASETLTVFETGHWWSLPRDPARSLNGKVAFRKAFRMKRKECSVFAVLDLNLGYGSGRHLVDLKPSIVSGLWKTDKAHLCGADSYQAELAILGGETLRLTWVAQGPEKCYSNHSVYQDVGVWIRWMEV